MTTVAADQVQYESSVRFRWAIVAFAAAILLVVAQLIQLSGAQAPVSELTVSLITDNQRTTSDIIGAIFDMGGLLALAALLNWLHHIAQARQPTLKTPTRWVATTGGVLTAVFSVVYTVIFATKVHEFVTTGNQSYPEASRLARSTALLIPGLVLELGQLMLAVGVVLVALSVMRVGLFNRLLGYTGVISGALFIIGIPVVTPVVQGYWLAATAVLLAGRWPSGDPPAWQSGTAVPWTPVQRPPDQRGTRAQRERRRRVSDEDVLAAVQPNEAPPNPRAGRSKRKRRK
ncbi:MAG TPA: hypothetical protein VGG96_11500 [Steroidobacteraceae bacterium]|jgi:hypothetical protein